MSAHHQTSFDRRVFNTTVVGAAAGIGLLFALGNVPNLENLGNAHGAAVTIPGAVCIIWGLYALISRIILEPHGFLQAKLYFAISMIPGFYVAWYVFVLHRSMITGW